MQAEIRVQIVKILSERIDSNDSLEVKVDRVFPDGSKITANLVKIKAPFYKDTVTIKVATEPGEALGINTLTVILDPNVLIDEMDNLAQTNILMDTTCSKEK